MYSNDNRNYVNGQYTYTSSRSNGWSVQLTDKASTEPVNTVLCTYINDRPITSFSNTFRDSEAVSIDLGKINTKYVTSMYAMFMNSKATTIKGLELFDTSKVTEMQHMFRNTNFLSLDLSSFDTSDVTTMYRMFQGCKAKTLDLSSFNIGNVIDMIDMFRTASATTEYSKNETIASKFNDSNVTGIPSTLKFIVK